MDIAKISYHWDMQGDTSGWYVTARDSSGQIVDDSEKVWFPVEVDEFTAEQSEELTAALAAAFPGVEISAR